MAGYFKRGRTPAREKGKEDDLSLKTSMRNMQSKIIEQLKLARKAQSKIFPSLQG